MAVINRETSLTPRYFPSQDVGLEGLLSIKKKGHPPCKIHFKELIS